MKKEEKRFTEEEYKNFQERIEDYKKGAIELSEKTGIIILTQALLTPDGRITSQLVFGDKKTIEEQQRVQNMNRHQKRVDKIKLAE